MEIFERKLEKVLQRYINRREILIVRGPRQAGKTTLLKLIYNKIKGDKAFVNLDLPDMRRSLGSDPISFVSRFKKEGRLYLFLDEVQRVKDAGEKLKIIYDEMKDVKMFVSGSSSLEMKTNLLRFLVGRTFVFDLLTFDFSEFLSAKDKGLKKVFEERQKSVKEFIDGKTEEVPNPVFEKEFLSYVKEYMIFGGYPEVIKAKDAEEKKTILKNIYQLLLEKDISSFFGIRDLDKFEDFTRAIAFNISNLLSLNSIASDLKISYRKAENFLLALKHSFVISLLKPFHKNVVTEIKKASKPYFIDLGLRNAILDNFLEFDKRADSGALLENFVFLELLKNFDGKIKFWRTAGKAEVDFLIQRGGEITPVEVKIGSKLGKSFFSFLKAYSPKRALVVTMSEFDRMKIGKTMVYKIPVFYV